MGLTATDKGGTDFAIAPAGVYTARAYKLIDLGTQTTTGMYGVKDQHKIMLAWELLDEPRMEDGKPFIVTEFYTVSLHEKAKLRTDLEAWRGRPFTPEELEGFDLSSIVGAYCTIQVIHDEKDKYANKSAIMAFKGTKPEPVNANIVFDIDNPDMEVFNNFSDNMKAKIMNTPEWKSSHQQSKPEPSKQVDDVVITDIPEEDPINLDNIPF